MAEEYSSFTGFESATPEDIINTAIERKINNIVNTSSIGKVTAVEENRVDLELIDGMRLVNVPLCASAFGGWSVSIPVKVDDMGIVLFNKYELSTYKTDGTFSSEKIGQFSQNNGVFIPFGLYNQPEVTDDLIITNGVVTISVNSDNQVEVSNDGGSIVMDNDGNITIKGSKAVVDADNIELGESATEQLVLGNTFMNAMNQILTTIAGHTHEVTTTGSATTQTGTTFTSSALSNISLDSSILSDVSNTK